MRRFLLVGLLFFQMFNLKADWTKCPKPAGVYPFSLDTHGDTIYLGTLQHGMYRSYDGGSNWTEINSGIVNKQIWTVYYSGTILLAAATNGNVYRSTNKGDSWEAASGIGSNTIVRSFAAYDGKMFAASNNRGVYISTDNGLSWTQHNSGIVGLVSTALLVAENDLYAGVLQSVYKYDRSTQTWSNKGSGLPNNSISCLTYNSKNRILFAGNGNNNKVSRSDNYAASWVLANNGLPNVPVYTITAVGNSVFVGNDYGVYQTTDNGDNWIDVSKGFPNAYQVSWITLGGSSLYLIQGADLWKQSIASFGITGINETLVNQDLEIFPNPATDFIKLKVPESVNRAEIYTVSGRLVHTDQTGSEQLDIRLLKEGMYLIKVYGTTNIRTGRFVKH